MDSNSGKSSGTSIAVSELVSESTQFRTLLDQVRAGSQDAAWQLLELYGSHVFRVVRRHLNTGMRTRFDSADFVQSVWASFFTHCVQVQSFSTPGELIAFLSVMARNKVIDRVRQSQARSRDIRRELSIEHVSKHERAELRYDVTPSDFAVAREKWNSLINGQPPRQQTIVSMKFMGETDAAIAAHLRVSLKTVRRTLDRLLLKATA